MRLLVHAYVISTFLNHFFNWTFFALLHKKSCSETPKRWSTFLTLIAAVVLEYDVTQLQNLSKLSYSGSNSRFKTTAAMNVRKVDHLPGVSEQDLVCSVMLSKHLDISFIRFHSNIEQYRRPKPSVITVEVHC